MNTIWSGKLRAFVYLALAAVAFWAFSAGWQEWRSPFAPVARPQLSFQGEGKVFGKPDIATISVAVLTEGEMLADVQRKNTERSNAVTAFLQSQAVAERDVRTVGYDITPKYNYPRPCPSFVPCVQEQQIVGYNVRHVLEVTVRDLERAGTVLNGVVKAGANEVSGFRFAIEHEEALRQEAREQAIRKAKEKARAVTDSLEVKLARIVSFYESGGGIIPPYARAVALEAGFGCASPDVQPGTQEIQVNVTITYEVK